MGAPRLVIRAPPGRMPRPAAPGAAGWCFLWIGQAVRPILPGAFGEGDGEEAQSPATGTATPAREVQTGGAARPIIEGWREQDTGALIEPGEGRRLGGLGTSKQGLDNVYLLE